ncbi:MAG: AraC family transcriptional regulator [Chitinophagaceae bacterium]|nr:MAG: AraC family transcriptional regulator [Chitinophagaceae bacterium]
MSKNAAPHIIQSISELHRLFALPKPEHPLVSVINFELLSYQHSDVWKHFANDFYCITLKKGSNAKFKYGQRDYDFTEGMMTFTKPRQVFSVTAMNDNPVTGYMLVFKADLIRPYPLGKTISNYGFFAYALAEALHLSDKEEVIISNLLLQMQNELKNNIDNYSQDVIVSHIELLLTYANRFYNRQFLTRKAVNNDLLERLEQILDDYFTAAATQTKGLPTVQAIAHEVNLSPSYLSDLLRNTTGLNAQQYIQQHLVEKAKELLTTTDLSISEIAYQLGFEYSQSFSKLFKKNTRQTPLEYRQSFN